MAVTCSKCNKRRKRASFVVQGGKAYAFCSECAEDLKDYTPTSIESFIEESWLERNIRKARERRATGESSWAKK